MLAKMEYVYHCESVSLNSKHYYNISWPIEVKHLREKKLGKTLTNLKKNDEIDIVERKLFKKKKTQRRVCSQPIKLEVYFIQLNLL